MRLKCVILLPENLFFNTSAPGIILVLNKPVPLQGNGAGPAKRQPHSGEILLINASKLFEKGRPKNYMSDKQVQKVADLFLPVARGRRREQGDRGAGGRSQRLQPQPQPLRRQQ